MRRWAGVDSRAVANRYARPADRYADSHRHAGAADALSHGMQPGRSAVSSGVPGADEYAYEAANSDAHETADSDAHAHARTAADSNTVSLRYEAKRRLQEVLNREEEHGKFNVQDN